MSKLIWSIWLLLLGVFSSFALLAGAVEIPACSVPCFQLVKTSGFDFDGQIHKHVDYDGFCTGMFDYDGPVVRIGNERAGQTVSSRTFFAILGNFLAAEGGIQTLDASAIRFSQNSVNGVGQIVDNMAANGWQGGPVTVVQMADGGLTTVDNTRVLAASLTGTPVQATIMDAGATIDASQAIRFVGPNGELPTTWGDAVLNRIGNQNNLFQTTYPSGSPFTGISKW